MDELGFELPLSGSSNHAAPPSTSFEGKTEAWVKEVRPYPRSPNKPLWGHGGPGAWSSGLSSGTGSGKLAPGVLSGCHHLSSALLLREQSSQGAWLRPILGPRASVLMLAVFP